MHFTPAFERAQHFTRKEIMQRCLGLSVGNCLDQDEPQQVRKDPEMKLLTEMDDTEDLA
jgi:hypothetical protein